MGQCGTWARHLVDVADISIQILSAFYYRVRFLVGVQVRGQILDSVAVRLVIDDELYIDWYAIIQ